MKTIAMIPARMGSARLKKKNLAMISGRPMVSYAVVAAKESGVFDEIFLNSEDSYFEKVAQDLGVRFYKRPENLGSSSAKSDFVVWDFMMSHPADCTVWVNSVSPLQPADEIAEVVSEFKKSDFDSLITTNLEQVHCLYENKPLNFNEGLFAQTQDLKPIERFVYSLMMWRNESFIKNMNSFGHGLMDGKFTTRVVSKQSGIIVKNESDFELVEAVIRGRESRRNQEKLIHYHDEVNL